MTVAMCESGLTGAETLSRALGVSLESGEHLSRVAIRRRFRSGETVWFSHDPASSIHVVTRGTLLMSSVTRSGNSIVLDVYREHDVVGVADAQSSDAAHPFHLFAATAASTVCLRYGDIAARAQSTPSMWEAVARLSAVEAGRAARRTIEVASCNAEERVAAALLRVERGDAVDLSQNTLASIANVSRPTTNRILADFAAKGYILVTRMAIVILNRPALVRLA